ncbi:uncharacterized protein J8A68_001662 [[Candida] subhashii]|uniref:Uncharacterized protein n=1 Tax=[Candida] subhashii TaxID=561895 RepID=A0A8J5R1Q9_9ASCO|nr:uncharacterized protein J8A68_001662 [[Candida] subhashii]KAG7664780.1 hypothetical protein J8A68_001662 [[Candida] subhashii]
MAGISTDSDPISSDDELDIDDIPFTILNMISGNRAKYQKPSPTPVSTTIPTKGTREPLSQQRTIPPSSFYSHHKKPNNASIRKPRSVHSSFFTDSDSDSDSGDDFNITLPKVFQFNAEKNEKIFSKEQELRQVIQQETENLKQEVDNINSQKNTLVAELNSDGTQEWTKKPIDLKIEDDQKLIDSLMRQNYKRSDGFGISRHFFFLNDIKSIEFGEEDSGRFPLTQALLGMIMRDKKSGWEFVHKKTIIKRFVFSVLESVQNHDQLMHINELISMNRDTTVEMLSNEELISSNEELLSIVKKCGGTVEFISSESVPIKMDQFNNCLKLGLFRLAIVLNFYLCCWNDPINNEFLKCFIFIISDFNVNKREYSGLKYFIKSVFTNIINSLYPDQHIEFVKTFTMILNNIRTNIFGESEILKIKKMDYELKFNVLRLLNNVFSTTIQSNVLSIIEKLNYYSVLGSDFDISQPIQPDTFDNMIQKITSGLILENMFTELEKGNYEMANQIYQSYYEIKHLPYLLIHPFNFQTTREENSRHLNRIKSLIEDLRKNILMNIKQVGSVNLDESKFNRQELVKFITDNYHDLNYMCTKLDKELDLVKSDIFYKTNDDE